MILYYLSAENLRSNAFVKDFAFYFKPQGKAMLLHGFYGSPADTRFVSKRLSAYLSEEMLVNTLLNGDQRQLLSPTDGGVQVRAELIEAAFTQVNLVILNTMHGPPESAAALDPARVIAALRGAFEIEELVLFPGNPRSALGAQSTVLQSQEDVQRLQSVYEEEASLLSLASALLPVTLLNPAVLQRVP